MASWTRTSPQHTAWRRLLALLLVMFFAFSTLPGHASADACQVDCALLQVEMLDTEEPCDAICAAPAATAQPAIFAPNGLPLTETIAVSDYVPQPPHRPPRA
ncbi:hypothetical protein ACFPTY_09855 [Halomonas beimenensis]|uniref:DUF2946 domain-containing protein n=1 Tax=Halomonas beimenensis TaxID=475662 RepID=A0A291P8W1_9GAMM|nr:hypothetical protein [Halomonas beimenensis]ATJ83309.1 hypothetical protein BEI_2322 [Halomonas beimenensis]